MNRVESRKNLQLDWLWTALRAICIAVIAVTLVMMGQKWLESRSAEASNRRLQDLYSSYAGAEEIAPEATLPPVQEALAPILAENADTVGWLTAGESISMPIVQYTDNDYYLYRDFYGKDSKAGTLFMDRRCVIWPANSHWMIHGHNMKDGAMFGTLDDFRDVEYLKRYPIVSFNTIYEECLYVPVALFDASMTKTDKDYFKIARFEFADDAEFVSFADEIRAHSLFEIPVDVQAGDQLLTLVTCSYSQDNGRLLIVCRKLREGETAEQMTELMKSATVR